MAYTYLVSKDCPPREVWEMGGYIGDALGPPDPGLTPMLSQGNCGWNSINKAVAFLLQFKVSGVFIVCGRYRAQLSHRLTNSEV